MTSKYDLAVIGTGPAGQKAAINAAKNGKRVVAIEHENYVGGVCIHTGTIPSKAFREAAMHLTGYRMRGVYGASYLVKRNISMADLIQGSAHVIRHEVDVVKAQMQRNNVHLLFGHARFLDANTIRIGSMGGVEEIQADVIVIATGTVPARPANIPFQNGRVVDSDGVLKLTKVPKSIIIVGGGVIGVEYACTMATLGVRVTLIEQRPRLLEFIDAELSEALQYLMRQMRIRLRLGEAVAEVRDEQNSVTAILQSGKEINAQTLMFSTGRGGNTLELDIESAGLTADERGRIRVDEQFRTEVPHIFAAGDVIGFPSLASTSAEQGRRATSFAFGLPVQAKPALMPYGIYTIPEISMIGKTEEELTKALVPYEVGIARYREIARGHLVGDQNGMLKLLFDPTTRKLLSVHILGEGATELVHIGQSVITFGGTIDYFIQNVFNYPTLAECYKVAALDGINRSAATGRHDAECEQSKPTRTPSPTPSTATAKKTEANEPVPVA